MTIIPSNNLNMASKNPKHEKCIEKQWFLKRFKLGQGGRMPLQHEHTPLLALGLNSNEDDGAPSGRILSGKRWGL
jgi:hypothetical protein